MGKNVMAALSRTWKRTFGSGIALGAIAVAVLSGIAWWAVGFGSKTVVVRGEPERVVQYVDRPTQGGYQPPQQEYASEAFTYDETKPHATVSVRWFDRADMRPVPSGFLPKPKATGQMNAGYSVEGLESVGIAVGGTYDGWEVRRTMLTLNELGGTSNAMYVFAHPLRNTWVVVADSADSRAAYAAFPVYDDGASAKAETFVDPYVDLDRRFSLDTSFVDTQNREYRVYTNGWSLSDLQSMPFGVTKIDARLAKPFAADIFLSQGNERADNTFYVYRPDGLVTRLVGDSDFFHPLTEEMRQSYWYALMPAITWTDGEKPYANTEPYFNGRLGGCGTSYQVVSDESADGPFTKIGITEHGDPVYSGKNVRLDDAALYAAPNQYGVQSTHPVFFWRDAWGRMMRFETALYAPAAECGKPVIYLYPEQTTDVSVHVEPKGGMSVSDPAYNGGWNVTADPDGTLTNHADGKTYPYLFWEGRGSSYAPPQTYWVVPREGVHAFLVDTLARIGLNAHETADFLEFWEPRMQAKPWYKIGFHLTRAMDEIAPLTVQPAPKSVLRVLMDYTGLDERIPANPPARIPSFMRDGFTVVEWGGVLQ